MPVLANPETPHKVLRISSAAALPQGLPTQWQVLISIPDDVSVPELFSNPSDLTTNEKESLVTMISKYQTELNECGDQPKVPYEHEIKVVDDRPVCSPARRLPYSQREEIDNQIDTLLE